MNNPKIDQVVAICKEEIAEIELRAADKRATSRNKEKLIHEESVQKAAVEESKSAAESQALMCAQGTASRDTLRPFLDRQTEAENILHETQLLLRSTNKVIDKMESEANPTINPIDAAKAKLFLSVVDILREELLPVIPIIHEAYCAKILSAGGRPLPWEVFLVHTLALPSPTLAERQRIYTELDAMILPDDSRSEQATERLLSTN